MKLHNPSRIRILQIPLKACLVFCFYSFNPQPIMASSAFFSDALSVIERTVEVKGQDQWTDGLEEQCETARCVDFINKNKFTKVLHTCTDLALDALLSFWLYCHVKLDSLKQFLDYIHVYISITNFQTLISLKYNIKPLQYCLMIN